MYFNAKSGSGSGFLLCHLKRCDCMSNMISIRSQPYYVMYLRTGDLIPSVRPSDPSGHAANASYSDTMTSNFLAI